MDLDQKKSELLKKLSEKIPLEKDPFPQEHGVLLSDRIEYYARNHNLIDPLDAGAIKAAGYEISVGDEFYLGGSFFSFSSDRPPVAVEIKPFDVAVIKTKEIFCLPRFLIARWNLRVRWAYEGLLWIGAAQVDPGFVGHLYCPIYNLSERTIRIHQGEKVALIDFVKTTPFHKGESSEYPQPRNRNRNILEEYLPHNLQSALVTRAEKRIDEAEDRMEAVEGRVSTFTALVLAVIAIGVTAGLALGSSWKGLLTQSWLTYSILALATFATVLSVVNLGALRFSNWLKRLERYPVHWPHDFMRGHWGRRVLAYGIGAFLALVVILFVSHFIVSNYIVKFNSRIDDNSKSIEEIKKKLP